MKLEVKELCQGYGGRPVIEDVSFSAECGEVISVLGPAGLREVHPHQDRL